MKIKILKRINVSNLLIGPLPLLSTQPTAGKPATVNWASGPEALRGVYYLMEESCALDEDFRNDKLPS